MKKFLLILFAALTTAAASAQGLVQGRVVDSNRDPISGVSVMLAGTRTGTTTDASGRYSLRIPATVPAKPAILFTHVGMEPFETPWNGETTVNATLFSATLTTQEVVVTGVGNLNVNEYTGSHVTLKVDSILNPAVQSLDAMLAGQVPGMVVTVPSMRAGAAPNIVIRGKSTLLGATEPLWVVDGIIQADVQRTVSWGDDFSQTEMDEYIGSAISWLNPMDVESITVLKDASATAIYGSRASNGVIVVTTKRGTEDKLSVNGSYNLSVGQKYNYGLYDLMNSQERINFSKQAYDAGAYYGKTPLPQMYTYEGMYNMFLQGRLSEADFIDQYRYLETVNTDWFDLLTRPSLNHSANISATGGTRAMNYVVSASYSDQQAAEKGNDNTRFTGRVGVDIKLSDRVRINTSITGSMSKTHGFAGSGIDPIGYGVGTSRAVPAYNPDGTLAFYQRHENYSYNSNTTTDGLPYNVLDDMRNTGSMVENPTMQANIDFKWEITPELEFQVVGGYSNNSRMSQSWMGEGSYYTMKNFRGYRMDSEHAIDSEYRNAAILKNGGVLVTDHLMARSFNVRNQLNYTRSFRDGDHRLTAMAMWEVSSTRNNSKHNTVYGYDKDRGERINPPTLPSELVPVGGATPPKGYLDTYDKYRTGAWGSIDHQTNMASLVAILAYTMNSKYVLNANFRNDWSNAFGQNANKRFNPAWSVGIMWRLGDEAFMDRVRPLISAANFRLSYGTQGNVGATTTSEMIMAYQPVHYIYDEPVSNIASIANPYLTWERTKAWNGGLDLGLFDNRVTLVVDGYTRLSNVGRRFYDTPENGGFQSMLTGTMIRNSGIEGSISITPLQTEKWKINLTANSGKNWNKIVKEANRDEASYDITKYITGQNENIIMEGYPLGAFWAYPYAGPDAEYGIPRFYNFEQGYNYLDPAGRKSVDYLRYAGTNISSVSAGLTLRVSYRNVTLTSQFTATLGGKNFLYNPYSTFDSYGARMPDPTGNISNDLLDRWTPDNKGSSMPGLYIVPDESQIPINVVDPTSPNGTDVNRYEMWGKSDVRVASMSALRCSRIGITWRIRPEKTAFLQDSGLRSLNFSAGVNNVFLLADKRWGGMDPDLGGDRKMPRSFSVGINLGF